MYIAYISALVPIDIERFELEDDATLRQRGTNADRVLSFLARNADRAFTPTEIAGATDVPRNSIGAVLARLRERDLVRHKGHYWAVGDDDALASYASVLSTASTMTDRFGPEDPADWNPDGVEE